MTLRNFFRVSRAISAFAYLLVIGVMAYSMVQTKNMFNRMEESNRIVKLVSMQNLFRYEYLRAQEERPLIQWLESQEALEASVQRMKSLFHEKKEKIFIQEFEQTLRLNRLGFEVLISDMKSMTSWNELYSNTGRGSIFIHRLIVTSVILTSQATQINNSVENEFPRFQQKVGILLFLLFLLLIGIIFLNSHLVKQNVISPLAELTEFARKMSEGNLDQEISIDARNEVGFLAAGINEMRLRLRDLYASLIQTNELLETRVKERTEEINARTKELERSNSALEQFAYIASHDLKEPLRKVSNLMHLS